MDPASTSVVDDGTPLLSVIVASAHGPEHLKRCLEALMPQVQRDLVEIIVVGVSSASQEARSDGVLFLPFPPATPAPVLWGAGLTRARGELIAVTETLTIVSEGWVEALLHACTPERPIAGGAVDPMPTQSLVSWAAYFCDYGQFMRPLLARTVRELPGNNVVFRRALLKHAPGYTHPSFWKTYWCQALEAEGIPLTSDPSILAFNAKQYRLGAFLLRRFRHGRCFGGMRREQMSVIRRAAYLAGSSFLPMILLLRLTSALLPKQRFRKQFFASLPVSLLAVVSWSAGEVYGYLAGPGNSCRFVY